MRLPVIGITLDTEEPGGYSRYPWYAVRKNYCEAVAQAGAVPMLVPHESAHIPSYLERLDGLIVTGGHFDVDPLLFGDETRHPEVKLKTGRTDFELKIASAFIRADKPVLGICGGEQLLNVALGGTLIQHIPDEVKNPLSHEQPNPRSEPGHKVKILDGSLLREIVGANELSVNSAHHQAVKALGKGLRTNALAPDGVIEGIEANSKRFLIGVQWHPEFLLSEGDKRLFRALVRAAS
jgi:putative glutamine amidotransferase